MLTCWHRSDPEWSAQCGGIEGSPAEYRGWLQASMANVIPPRALVEIQARVQRVVSEQRAALLCLAALLCGKTMPCWCVCNVAHSGHARARAGYSGRSSCPEHLRASIRRCAPRQDHQAVAVGCGCGLWLWRAVLAHVNAAVMGAAFDRVRPSAVRLHRTMPAHARRYVVYANAGLQEG